MTQFQSETNNLDLYSDALWWCGLLSSDTTSYPIKDFTRNANFGLDRATNLIIKADGKWKHDDTNNATEILDTTTDLVSGTKKYAVSVTWLKVGSPVRVKDSAGNWTTLDFKSRNQLTDSELSVTGVPTTYDKIGNYIYLSPTPNFTQSDSLEVPFQRGPSYFAYTDTTKTPGFASSFHRLISMYAAIDYCNANELVSRSKAIQLAIDKMESDLQIHYSERNDDEQPNLNIQRDDYGQTALVGTSSEMNPKGF